MRWRKKWHEKRNHWNKNRALHFLMPNWRLSTVNYILIWRPIFRSLLLLQAMRFHRTLLKWNCCFSKGFATKFDDRIKESFVTNSWGSYRDSDSEMVNFGWNSTIFSFPSEIRGERNERKGIDDFMASIRHSRDVFFVEFHLISNSEDRVDGNVQESYFWSLVFCHRWKIGLDNEFVVSSEKKSNSREKML